ITAGEPAGLNADLLVDVPATIYGDIAGVGSGRGVDGDIAGRRPAYFAFRAGKSAQPEAAAQTDAGAGGNERLLMDRIVANYQPGAGITLGQADENVDVAPAQVAAVGGQVAVAVGL